MIPCPVTRCGAWLNSTARNVDTTSGEGTTSREGADPTPSPSAPPQPRPAPPCPGPILAKLALGPSRPCPPPGAGHRWGPGPPATGAASLCIRHGSSLRAGIATRIAAVPTPTPAPLRTATIGEVSACCVRMASPVPVYVAWTPGISTSGALRTKVSACFFHLTPKVLLVPRGHFISYHIGPSFHIFHRPPPPCLQVSPGGGGPFSHSPPVASATLHVLTHEALWFHPDNPHPRVLWTQPLQSLCVLGSCLVLCSLR